jgi:hypothetical protein
MTDQVFEQQPFGDATFADNPENRCPVVLVLDTSGSMSGSRINELNAGLQTFRDESPTSLRRSALRSLLSRSDPSALSAISPAFSTFRPLPCPRPEIRQWGPL